MGRCSVEEYEELVRKYGQNEKSVTIQEECMEDDEDGGYIPDKCKLCDHYFMSIGEEFNGACAKCILRYNCGNNGYQMCPAYEHEDEICYETLVYYRHKRSKDRLMKEAEKHTTYSKKREREEEMGKNKKIKTL